MTEHPDLVALTRAELTNAEALAAGDHLGGCAACREDLAELVVGASVLRRAAAALGDPVGGAVGKATGGATGARPTLPSYDGLRERALRPSRGRVVALSMAAAAVVVASVLGVGALLGRGDDGPTATPAPGPTARVFALDAVEGSGSADVPASGQAHLVADGGATAVTIETDDLPDPGAGEFYYAWLLEPATQKMLPLGVVSGTTTFTVDDALLDGYQAVDLSLEADDGDPGHSVTSVLRGAYADPTPD